jgi:hypothetical protein
MLLGVSIYEPLYRSSLCTAFPLGVRSKTHQHHSFITSKGPAELDLRAEILPTCNSAPILRCHILTLIIVYTAAVKPRLGAQTVVAVLFDELHAISLRRIMLIKLYSRERRCNRCCARLDQSVCAMLAVLEDVDVDSVRGTDAIDVDVTCLTVAADAADCLGHCRVVGVLVVAKKW